MAEVPINVGGVHSTAYAYPDLKTSPKIVTKSQGRPSQVEYYRGYDIDEDQMVGLFCKEVYTYSGNSLTQMDVSWYNESGDIAYEESVIYQTDSSNSNITREYRVKV